MHFSENEIIDSEIKRKKLVTHGCQTDSAKLELAKITEEDLTTEGEPSEGYWKVLAEKRRVALDISLQENEELFERVNSLEDELETSRKMLDESRNLVEILTEMLQEEEGDRDASAPKPGCSKDLINASLAEEAIEQEDINEGDIEELNENEVILKRTEKTPDTINHSGN